MSQEPVSLSTDAELDSSATSSSLIEKVKQGEADAWQRLVDIYRPWLIRYCKRCGLSESDAENATQEVFLSFYQRATEFKRERRGSFRKWLRLVARSRLADLFRSKTDLVIDSRLISNAVSKKAIAKEGNASGSVRSIERFDTIMGVVKSEFSDRDLKILIDYLGREQTPRQISEEYRVSENVVYLVRSRIVKRLRDLIDVYPIEEDGVL